MVLNVVIMAAGKGTRMHSARPKVLLQLAGSALLHHVMRAAAPLAAERTLVIVGHGADAVTAALAGSGADAVLQTPQLGTGHAVQQAAPLLLATPGGTTLILNGDTPLLRTDTARRLVDACGGERLALLTERLGDATGYGRIVRRPGDGDVVGIVEHKDASDAQRQIDEVYTGIMAVPTGDLLRWLPRLSDANAQREFYLTDIVAMAVADGTPVTTVQPGDRDEALGVNSARQLADLERRFQRARADVLLDAGVRLADPARIDVRGTLRCGHDVEIDVGCVFIGDVELGDGVTVGAHCVLRDASVGADTVLQPFSHVDGARIGARAAIGPYARLRPGARLGDEVHIGNFVEVKNSTLGDGAKANHLAYLGDATVGARVNFGAGSITANYDGAKKHVTHIGADVHVGSNCVLVAPVTLGDGATIGGGSTITRDVPAGQLAVSRARQALIPGWQRPRKG